MLYHITLENYFIDINTFNTFNKFNQAGPHPNTTPLSRCNRWTNPVENGPLLPDNLASNNPSPFIIGSMLYYPIVVGLNNSAANGAGGVVGFVRAKISNNLELGDSEYMVCSSEDLKKAGVRLSVQSIKMLKSLRHNSKLNKNESNGTIRHYNTQGFKCRPEEIIKCLAFGYLDFPNGRTFIEDLAHASRDQSYTLQELVSDKRNDMQTICAAVAKHYHDTERSFWSNRTIGTKISYDIMRTSINVDEKCVVKWRRPSKNSKWPYTLDHHWFCCQESSVTMAHHTMASLMFTASSTPSKSGGYPTASRDQLMMNLPIFLSIRTLDNCRKILENFFVNIVEILKTNSSATGHYTNLINDFDWPVPNRYSGKRLEAEMFPVKAALAMGVLPKFDESGRFNKFIPIDGVLHENPQTIYIDVDSDYLKRRRPEHSLLLMYSTGIIRLEDLEKIVGSVSQNDKDHKNNSTKVQLRMSKNVVCCLPVESASKKIYETLAREGYNHFGVNSNNSSKLNDPLQEIEEYTGAF